MTLKDKAFCAHLRRPVLMTGMSGEEIDHIHVISLSDTHTYTHTHTHAHTHTHTHLDDVGGRSVDFFFLTYDV